MMLIETVFRHLNRGPQIFALIVFSIFLMCELVLAYIFSACNCFMKYCRTETVAGVTYTQFTSHKFAITDKLKR